MQKSLKIVVTGANGFIGSALIQHILKQGHIPLAIQRTGGQFDWTQANGAHVLIHLAGRNIAAHWSAKFKSTMLAERRAALQSLAATWPSLNSPPHTVIIASAIGHYGETWQPAHEDAPMGKGFAAEICKVLETTLPPLPNTRIVYARIGVVLHPSGGALAKMLPTFRFGLGGPIGSGKQILSWVSRHDVCRALLHLAQAPNLQGPYNVVSPAPLPQAEFAKQLGNVLHRPAVLPMPAIMIKLMFGQMGTELLLQSCAVSADKLLQTGFTFTHPTTIEALNASFNPGI